MDVGLSRKRSRPIERPTWWRKLTISASEVPPTQVEGSARRMLVDPCRDARLGGLLLSRALAWPIDAQPRPRVARLALIRAAATP